jgi:predicted amidohydrolase
MPTVCTAVWTLNTTAAGGANATARNDELETVALTADTQLKLLGRRGGGPFQRLLIVPEYFHNAGGALLSRSTKHQIYERLINLSRRVPELILIAGTIAYEKGVFSTDVYNVCPILFGGQIVKKLYKANNDHVYDINGSFRTKTDGGKGVPVATIQGVSIGLDICLDYNQERLGQYLNATGTPRPAIHVQISGTNANQPSKAQCAVNGVYLHCDQGGKGANGARAFRITARDGLGMAAFTEIQRDAEEQRAPGSTVRTFILNV